MWKSTGLVGILLLLVPRGTNHLSKYLSLSFGYVLGKVIPYCYSFAGSSSVLVMDTLVEGP